MEIAKIKQKLRTLFCILFQVFKVPYLKNFKILLPVLLSHAYIFLQIFRILFNPHISEKCFRHKFSYVQGFTLNPLLQPKSTLV